jgi:Protein kinase domain
VGVFKELASAGAAIVNSAGFQRLRKLFEAALQQEPENREVFLEVTCPEDEDMRQEVLSLLRSHREAEDFLETPVLAMEDEMLAEGHSVGPYVVQRELGRGGMGIVYLAEDTRLHRNVALKALSPKLLFDGRQRERFCREAALTASLSHPAIATIYALEEFSGRLYIASEYVPGDTLRAVLGHASIPVETIVSIGLQIAEGLAAAHDKNIVHRDLKPENVIFNERGKVKILDFGLALIPESQPVQRRLTEAGMFLGTPSYMSPEQLQGDPVDLRCDFFSLGVLLYELASGTNPFLAKSAVATAAKILETEPPKLDQLSRNAPKLNRLIRRCMQKNPEQRYQSDQELVKELSALASLQAEHSHEEAEVGAVGLGQPYAKQRLDSYWWVVHQTLVVVFYGVMVFVLWEVNTRNRGVPTLLLFYGVLACAIANGALRIHLLFTARFNRSALRRELSGTTPSMWRFDWLFSILHMAAAAAVLLDHHLMAGILAAVAVGYPIVFLVVEPATVRAVFPPADPY